MKQHAWRLGLIVAVFAAFCGQPVSAQEDRAKMTDQERAKKADEEHGKREPRDREFFKDTYTDGGGMVFFRGGLTLLMDSRGNEVFTDTLTIGTTNNDRGGWSVGAGLDIDLEHELVFGDLYGEILVDYARHSHERVLQTTSALLGGSDTARISVSQLTVAIAPKIQWEAGPLNPWLIPIGMAFLVNSPPSNDTTYLDLGLHFAAGADLMILKPWRLGVDIRYTLGFGEPGTENDYLAYGLYLGVGF